MIEKNGFYFVIEKEGHLYVGEKEVTQEKDYSWLLQMGLGAVACFLFGKKSLAARVEAGSWLVLPQPRLKEVGDGRKEDKNDEEVRSFLQSLGQAFSFDAIWLGVINPLLGESKTVVAWSRDKEESIKKTYGLSESLASLAWAKQETVVWPRGATAFFPKDMLLHPLAAQGAVMAPAGRNGVLAALSRKPLPETPALKPLFTFFGAFLADFIEMVPKRHKNLAQAFFLLERSLAATTVKESFTAFLSELAAFLQIPLAAIVWERIPGNLETLFGGGSHALGYLDVLSIRLSGETPAAQALREGKTLVVGREEPSFSPFRERLCRHGLEGVVAVPLLGEAGMRAVLLTYWQEGQPIAPSVVATLDALGARLSLALGLAIRQERLNLLESAVAAIPSPMFVIDERGILVWANPAFVTFYQLSEKDGLGEPVEKLGLGFLSYPSPQELSFGEKRRRVLFTRAKDGQTLAVEEVMVAFGREDKYLAVVQTDLSSKFAAEVHSAYLVTHDLLTGLLRREAFGARAAEMLGRAKQEGKLLGLLCFDIERFREINEALGVEVGDAILRTVSTFLAVEITEPHVLGRIGGDRFGIILWNHTWEEMEEKARKIQERLSTLFPAERKIHLTVRMGASLYVPGILESNELFREAELALTEAKRKHKPLVFHSGQHTILLRQHLQMERALRDAIDHQKFFLCYQPIVDTRSEKIVGAEALLRMQGEDGVTVSPLEFIPVAEETGLIIIIGEWVLREACLAMRRWIESGLGKLFVSVNVSPVQLRQAELAQRVKESLRQTGLNPGHLMVEVTESVLMENLETSLSILESLSRDNLGVAVDDFGTGYSSFAYLKKLPVNELKIDRAFIKDIGTSQGDGHIVRAIIWLAQALGLQVVAEGVENEAQLLLLREWGCHFIQGYYYSRPLIEEEFISWARQHAAT